MASASSETIAVTADDESTMTPSREMEATRLRMHGILGADRGWAAPELVTEFDVNARLSFTDIKAHEYVDVPEVMAQKVELLAHMILQAEQFILYTGAGISTAAGIDDYATKAKTESVTAVDRPVVQDWKRARPTRAHRVLTALYEAGLLKHWVQQNHDSLPQKAGFPQHALNEIHGSLHDPANPIVPYEGELRPDLFQWMREWKHKADLCLALGTSMSGFNADSVPVGIAKRFLTGEGGQGTVIINLQQTRHDEMASLRIYGKLDDVLDLLIKQLQMEHLVKPTDHVYQPLIAEGTQLEEDVFRVPFNEEGLPDDTTSITWDLKVGSWVRLTGGPYAGDVGVVTSKNEDGHYSIYFEHSINHTFNIKRRPFTLWLGSWWLEMATHGRPICPGSKIPFVNCAAPVVTAEAEAAAVDLTKYLRMRKIGLAEPAIRQKMECDLIPASQIDAFFASSSSASSSS